MEIRAISWLKYLPVFPWEFFQSGGMEECNEIWEQRICKASCWRKYNFSGWWVTMFSFCRLEQGKEPYNCLVHLAASLNSFINLGDQPWHVGIQLSFNIMWYFILHEPTDTGGSRIQKLLAKALRSSTELWIQEASPQIPLKHIYWFWHQTAAGIHSWEHLSKRDFHPETATGDSIKVWWHEWKGLNDGKCLNQDFFRSRGLSFMLWWLWSPLARNTAGQTYSTEELTSRFSQRLSNTASSASCDRNHTAVGWKSSFWVSEAIYFYFYFI